MTNNNRVLIIAAHPDDEVLGCGGTIAHHAAQGDDVHILIIAEGSASRDTSLVVKGHHVEIKQLRQAAQKAASTLGARPPIFLGLPDNRLDSLDLLDIIKKIEKVIGDILPQTVYTHHYSDLNIDHRITFQAVTTACRPLPGTSVTEIYAFETVSSTEWSTPPMQPFTPNHFVSIENFIDKKINALRAYKSEMRPFPHARSIEAVKALATLRGASVGIRTAEAFIVIRKIVK